MRYILHSDLNSFYASVEIVLDPSLRGRPIAVCGSRETRHGIVLAKSDPAKSMGVATGMAIWEARQCCPDLLIVPPHYGEYIKYSNQVHSIYARYTGFIEPYGLDECWLDVTGIKDRTGLDTAEEIRNAVQTETGLTVSIGVSFNKIFAKLGSDMKKPNAITVIGPNNFREKIWNLPVGDLFGVGPATQRKLHLRCIDTIGQLAAADPDMLRSWFGVIGPRLWCYANGLDRSSVAPDGYIPAVKSVGHGMTTPKDLESEAEVRDVLVVLVPRISRKLRQCRLQARGVQVSLRTNDLAFHQFQGRLPYPTQCTREIIECTFELFRTHYFWDKQIMAITVRAVDLISEMQALQLDVFGDFEERQRIERLERIVEQIQDQYGREAIQSATALRLRSLDRHPELEFVHMPHHAHQ